MSIPKILKLDAYGEPDEWIDYQECAIYYSKGKVLWSTGSHELTLRGGMNAKTGQQSKMVIDTIVSVGGEYVSKRVRKIHLTNQTLFVRDMNMCAYCGHTYATSHLTRDHVVPTSKGGLDKWENVVTACEACNNWKADRTPEQADMPLLYVPYKPSKNEHLILANRKILQCQMEFLLKDVSPHSRVRQMLTKEAA